MKTEGPTHDPFSLGTEAPWREPQEGLNEDNGAEMCEGRRLSFFFFTLFLRTPKPPQKGSQFRELPIIMEQFRV